MNILDRIKATKELEVKALKARNPEFNYNAPTKGFAAALADKVRLKQPAIIAEVKKASPSKGVIRENFDPVSIAKNYEAGGATCISVLTDEQYFQGSLDYLRSIRAHTYLPLLRKDFIIDPIQIHEARTAGADCILLIMAMLTTNEAKELEQEAIKLGMDVLVEVHNEAELNEALTLKTRLIGINNRNLKTFTVDTATTTRLAALLPQNHGYIVVCESGIKTRNDIITMCNNGIYCFLIGESLMKTEDEKSALANLLNN